MSDGDLLQRSMDAAPEEWLDRLVTDRVMTEVRQQEAAAHAEGRWCPAQSWPPLSRRLVAFRQHAIVVGFVEALAILATTARRRRSTPRPASIPSGSVLEPIAKPYHTAFEHLVVRQIRAAHRGALSLFLARRVEQAWCARSAIDERTHE